ncbi:fimbrial protein [Aeromonas salmonicida]|uniref:fimbrial protein n=1 Tax=Aeromonas salmonicida TaxID=645 RepID=UPI003F7C9077
MFIFSVGEGARIASCCILFITAANAANAASDLSAFMVTGKVVSAPCSLRPGDEYINIDMENVLGEYLKKNGRSEVKKFAIHLEKCSLDVAKTVNITFSGQNSGSYEFPVSNTSEAQGIYIGLEGPNGVSIRSNSPFKYPLSQGNTDLNFFTYIGVNGQVRVGIFSATINFKLDYN